MGIFNNLRKMTDVFGFGNDISNSSMSKQIEHCLIISKLSKAEFTLASILYYRGATSYRSFFSYVFFRNITKIKKIMNTATKQAEKGVCNMDNTVVRFTRDGQYIDIPFDVFIQKRNITSNQRNNKQWHRENIKRILVNRPGLNDLGDDDMMSEAFRAVLIENLEV